MATVPLFAPVPFITVGDVVAVVSDVPLSRIRLDPVPGMATEEDIFRVRQRENVLCELRHGTLVEKGMGHEESICAGFILTAINNYLDEHDIGRAAGPDGLLRLFPGLVRMPDVSLVLWEQLPGRVRPRQPIWDTFPTLAVEVLSASNTVEEMERKRTEYFAAGSRQVWIVDPPAQTIAVYTSLTSFHLFHLDDTLDGGDLLPGFHLPLRRVFRD